MKKHLYRDDEHTTETRAIDAAVETALDPLFADFVSKGYSVRELSHVIMTSVIALELKHKARTKLPHRVTRGLYSVIPDELGVDSIHGKQEESSGRTDTNFPANPRRR